MPRSESKSESKSEAKQEAKPESKTKYTDGEKVLCYHGKLIYEAKVIAVDEDDKDREYCVHYNGWNKAWDEWVPESRILKLNEAGLEKQKSLQLETLAEKSKQKGKKKKKAADIETTVKKRRSRQEQVQISAPPSPKKPTEVSRLNVTLALQKRLLEVADVICKQNKLIKLPAPVTVDKILEEFVEEIQQKDVFQTQTGTVEEVAAGIKLYFNNTLGTQLLYKQERQQFKELSSVTPSQHYGADHLLRLFEATKANSHLVRFGPALSQLSPEEDSQVILLSHLQLCLQFLEEKSATLFSNDYISCDEFKKPS